MKKKKKLYANCYNKKQNKSKKLINKSNKISQKTEVNNKKSNIVIIRNYLKIVKKVT